MDLIVHEYFTQSLAPSTATTYRSVANRYIHFCMQYAIPPLPLCQDNVTRFVAHLAQSGVTYQSIRTYLSGLRFFQVANGLADPYLSSIPVLEYVLRGIRRLPQAVQRNSRLPITPEVLQMLLLSWSQAPQESRYNATMLWAACCTGFFGFMRAGEFTCSSLRTYRPDMLSPQDVSVDSHDTPTVVSVHLRRSKADPFGAGVTVHLGRTGRTICPVAAILNYLALRGQQPGPLFTFQDGSPLSKQKLLTHLHQALECQGVDCSGITGHSFRIGAASTAARVGLEDSLIQTLGRWRSSAYLRYIRTSKQTLAAVSTRLLGAIH